MPENFRHISVDKDHKIMCQKISVDKDHKILMCRKISGTFQLTKITNVLENFRHISVDNSRITNVLENFWHILVYKDH